MEDQKPSAEEVKDELGGSEAKTNVQNATEKVERGDCPIRDEFTAKQDLTVEQREDTLKNARVTVCEKTLVDQNKESWREEIEKTEKNFIRYELRKQLRKKAFQFERFKKVQEGALDPSHKKEIDMRGKLILAPLTTVGNLPFRRLCKRLGADVTVGEMAIAENVLKGFSDDWALLRRHESEDLFGVQLAGNVSDIVARAVEVVCSTCDVDFIDLNCGCPIDLVCKRGAGCELMRRADRFRGVVVKASAVSTVPFSVKMRTGIPNDPAGWTAHKLIPKLKDWGASWVTLHGRSKDQRYRRTADWSYIDKCHKLAEETGLPFVGNGDIFSYEDAEDALRVSDSIMLARGALIKPWLFTEIKESRYIDMTPNQRLELYKEYVGYGLDHYGADKRGVESTRRHLLEWMSFTCRYPPVGIFEVAGERLNEFRPRLNQRFGTMIGRDNLEMMLSSRDPRAWTRISELLLGPVPEDFNFLPKHASNAWTEASIAFQD